jgi:hypothetical protein
VDGPQSSAGGWLSPQEAEFYAQFGELAEHNRRTLENRPPPAAAEKFPAEITGRTFDPVAGEWEYAWTEQTYSAAGARITKPGGRTGGTAWSPARPYGDGTALGRFPFPTTLRRRILTATKGPVYEFPYYCACVAGSGSGSGDDGVETTCCPGVKIPKHLHVTILAPDCACFAGQSFKLTGPGFWTDLGEMASDPWTGACRTGDESDFMEALCNGPNGFQIGIGGGASVPPGSTGCGLAGGGLLTPISFTCSPFSAVYQDVIRSTNDDPAYPCPCAGKTFTVIITE